jgi:hypothetical protein
MNKNEVRSFVADLMKAAVVELSGFSLAPDLVIWLRPGTASYDGKVIIVSLFRTLLDIGGNFDAVQLEIFPSDIGQATLYGISEDGMEGHKATIRLLT